MQRGMWFALVLTVAVAAQSNVDVALPPGTPNFSGPTFADATHVCVASVATASIYTWSGLPQSPALAIATPAGPLAVASAWTRIGEHTAAYDTVGGLVAIVRGLPSSPQILLTSLPAPASSLIGVNDSTAVRPTATGFVVLRHGVATSSYTTILSPQRVVLGFASDAGRADDATLLAHGAGPDGQARTTDDTVLRIDGLAGPTLAGITVVALPLPLGGAPEGFHVARSGGAVAWRNTGLGTFDLVALRVAGPAVVASPLSVTTPSPFGFFNAGPYYYSAAAAPPNGVVFRHSDDVGWGNVMVGYLDGAPSVIQSWFDDPINAYTSIQVLNDRDLVSMDFVSLAGFSYTRWTNGMAESNVAPDPYNFLDLRFVVPNARVIAAFSHLYSSTTIGQIDAALTIERQLPSGNSTVTQYLPDSGWVGTEAAGPGGGVSPRLFSMGPGAVAGFVKPNASPSGTPTTLHICSFGCATAHESYGKRFGVATAALEVQPPVPSVAASAAITVSLPGPAPTAAFLGVSLQRIDAIQLSPHDAFLHLAADGLLFLPVTLVNGSATFPIAAGIPPALIGVPFFLQFGAVVGTAIEMSDLGTLVFEP